MTFASDKVGNLIHCLRFIACGCFLCQVCHIIHVLPIISSRSMLHLFVCRPVLLLVLFFKPLGLAYLLTSTLVLLGSWRHSTCFIQFAFNVHTTTAPHTCKAHFHLCELVRAWNLDLSLWSLLGKGTFTHMASVFFNLSGLPNCWKCQAGRSSPEGLISTQLGYIQMTYEAGYKTPPQTPGRI